MPAAKRSAPTASDGRRRSGRASITLKKSAYFQDSDDESDAAPPPKKRGRPSKKQEVKEESEDQYEEEAEDDLEEEEADEETDEDAPPKVTFIPHVKLRDIDGVDYEDHKVHKNTMLFLKDLKANNRRPWLKSNDEEYRRALKDWQAFVETTTQSIIGVDETIPELPVKDVIFRIHRDIRFSKDPTPYKPHFSAAWSRTGRKGPYACYYIHCEPKAAFIGGGLWCPDKQQIDKLRASIDERPRRWRRALNDPLVKRVFFPGVKASTGPEGPIQAFIEKNKANALKKRPMNYLAEHRDIGLLRLKNFTIGTKIDEAMLCEDDAQEKITDIMRALSVLVTFLNSVVMPDNLDDDESDDDGEEE